MPNRRVTIFHFDDELGMVDWIPVVLRNHYRLKHPSWVKGPMQTLPTDEGDFLYSFTLTNTAANRSLEVRFGGYSTSELAAFLNQFRPGGRDTDILILDLFHNTRNGMEDVGTAFYREARKRLSSERIYLLTGYPDRAKSILAEHDLPPANLFPKPPNVGALVGELARKLQPLLPDV